VHRSFTPIKLCPLRREKIDGLAQTLSNIIEHGCASEDEMISLSPDYIRQLNARNTQVVGDIPPVQSVFDLKSGVRVKLVDRSGSMVIVEVEKYRSDWIDWSEVKARIAA
jgi:hypothetical protein